MKQVKKITRNNNNNQQNKKKKNIKYIMKINMKNESGK